MNGGEFLDSNVFIYSLDPDDPAKRLTARRLIGDSLTSGQGRISFQVIQETLNVITRKLRTTVRPDDARQLLAEVLMPLCRVMPSQALYERALDLHAEYRYSFYDSLIIAGALAGGCSRLFSEDLQAGQQIQGLTIINPFAA